MAACLLDLLPDIEEKMDQVRMRTLVNQGRKTHLSLVIKLLEFINYFFRVLFSKNNDL